MSKKSTTEEFIVESKKIHKDKNGNPKYDYSLVKYVSTHLKVIIICLKEGHVEFLQTPGAHKQGDGCPKCNCSKEKLK